ALAFAPFSRRAPAAPSRPPIRLQLAESLRVGDRYWLRGQIDGLPARDEGSWGRQPRARALHPFHVEIRAEGEYLDYSGEVRADGSFDVHAFDPSGSAPRGWRFAHVRLVVNEVTCQSQTVILDVPVLDRPVQLVILPLQLTA